MTKNTTPTISAIVQTFPEITPDNTEDIIEKMSIIHSDKMHQALAEFYDNREEIERQHPDTEDIPFHEIVKLSDSQDLAFRMLITWLIVSTYWKKLN